MSRRRKADKREILPDPKFGDLVLSKFMACLMIDGKKYCAEKIVYGALDRIKEKSGNEPLGIFKDALDKVKPQVEVRSRRVGGATFQIPSPIRSDRKISIEMKWLINYSRKRNEKSMAQKLAAEILAASKEEGAAVKKKVDTHKMAEANKAFSHFRF